MTSSARAWKAGMVPAIVLIAINALPLAGIQLPFRLLGMPFQVWLSLAAALVFAALFPLYWRMGYREAAMSGQESANVLIGESSRKLQEARYQEQKRSQELDKALKELKAKDKALKQLASATKRDLGVAAALVESSGEAIVITDVHGVIQYLSIPASNMAGIHRADAVDSPFDDVFKLFDPSAEKPDMHPVRRLAINAVDSTDTAPRLEACQLTHRTGKSRLVLVTSMAICDEEGTVIGAHIKLESQDSEGSPIDEARVPTQIDPVTGLRTRDAFSRRADELLRRARTQAAVHHLLFLGPDNFDFVSDRYGYRAAEQMLWKIAEVCRELASDGAQVYAVSAIRIGILMPDTDTDDAKTQGERIRQALQQSTLSWDEESIDFPVTIGVVRMDHRSPGIGPLLDLAENMLRSGRRAGGNQVFADVPMLSESESRFTDQGWVDWLQQRLQAGLGHVLSQEILPNGKKDKPMLECFVRVEDSDGVWISPMEYLPALRRAENTSFMDLWVLDQVLSQMSARPELNERYMAIAINLAAETIADKDFVGRASERIANSGIHSRHICFEILENTATMLPREVAYFVSLIQSSGAKVSIDQARGVGLMPVLNNCRPNFIKIDPILIRDFTRNDLTRAQVRWLVESAQLMDIKTVACGIEDDQAIEPLTQAGIDYLQGSAVNKMGPLML